METTRFIGAVAILIVEEQLSAKAIDRGKLVSGFHALIRK